MYYKIITDLLDKMRVYKETPLDKEHLAYGVDTTELRTPWSRDYFTIENGNIKLISGRRDEKEFDGVKIAYPKGTKEICLFMEVNKDSILPMTEELFIKDYKLNQHRNNLFPKEFGAFFCQHRRQDVPYLTEFPYTLAFHQAIYQLFCSTF